MSHPFPLNQKAGAKVKSIVKTIDVLSDWTGRIVSFLVVPITLVLVYETLMRYVFNAPTTWAYYVSSNLACVFFLIGAAYTLLYRGHVSMDAIYIRFPPRVKAIIDVITATIFFSFAGVLLWKSIIYAWDSVKELETVGIPLYLPLYPFKLFVPIGAFLLLLQGVAKFIRDLITAISGEKYEH